MNLRWSWDERTRDLFRWVDPDAWDATSHDPVRLLGLVRPTALDALAADPGFLRYLAEIDDELAATSSPPRWFQSRASRRQPAAARRLLLPRVRHRRGPAAVLGRPRRAGRRPPEGGRPTSACPLVGVGLFYRHGYFRQRLDRRRLAAGALPRRSTRTPWRCTCATASASRVDLAGEPLHRPRSGGPTSGASPLYLLDTDVDGNAAELRAGHRPPLRRRHRAPHPPGDRARHRRRAGAAGPRPRRRRCSTPTRATPASSASSASASWSPAGLTLRRGARGGAGRAACSPPTRRCRPASTASPAS